LPAVLGTTLIFGILRKELALLMLMQALGTTAIATVLTTTQIVVFTLFIMFYVPCLATLTTQVKEIGGKLTALAALYSLVLATTLALLARLVFSALLGS
ncbi:MAG: ferrous iron transport protein B, partial [Terriglobia bacterium]